ncbi:Cytochrome b561 and DOMON domain-containing protein [Nymphaea thermarum]|nr:Cytochrome b561 and DOMON domain-containing protein [Nymphaea thermarum]
MKLNRLYVGDTMNQHDTAALILPSCCSALSTCKSYNFPSNKTFDACTDLLSLNAYLHWTYSSATHSASIAYRATPGSPGGWVAWGINPTGHGMVGTQALLGFVHSGNITVYSTSVNDMKPKLAAENLATYSKLSGELSGREFLIYAVVNLPAGNFASVSYTWQTGPVQTGRPLPHPILPSNLKSFGKWNFHFKP